MASKVAIEVEIKNIKKVADLKESLKTLRKETKAYEKEVAEGTKQTEKSAKGYINSSKAIKKQSKDLRNLKKDLNSSTKSTKAATKSSNGMAKQFVKGAAAISVAVAAFKLVTGAISSAIETFKAFEFQMAKVRATTGATDKDFEKLTSSAQQLGRTTFFTASKVGELQMNFAKLGFSTSEILDAQEATLRLATATGSDLARAAVVAGAAVRGFNLDANETERVVDVMAVAFTSSALDIEKWQTSMTKIAPIAAGANISIETSAAIMGKLSDAGIEASIAGTSLRNIFLKMQDSSSDLSQHLGFTVNSSADLEKALIQLNSEGLSNEEIMGLVDLRQVAAFATMVNGTETIIGMTDALEDANGSAQEMADIMANTLEGDLITAKSAWEGFQLAIMNGSGFIAKTLREGTQIWTHILNRWSDSLKDVDAVSADIFTNTVKAAKAATKEGNDFAKNSGNKGFATTLSRQLFEENKKLEKGLNTKERLVKQSEFKIAKLTKDGQMGAFQVNAEAIADEQKILDKRLKIFNATKLAIIDLTEEIEVQKKKEVTSAETAAVKEFAAGEQEIRNKRKTQREKEKIEDKRLSDIEKGKKDAEKVAQEAFNNEKARIDIEARELSNTMKQGLIDNQLTQETFDTMAFDAEQQRLQDQLDLYIKYEKDTSAINGKMLSNTLKMISDEAAADAKAAQDKLDQDAQVKKDRDEQIAGIGELGSQLTTLAGNDEKYQKVRETGVKISAAAALATNAESLALQLKSLSVDLAKGFPFNIIAVASTLALMASMKGNISAIKGGKMAKGGMIEEFANGGMVNGKSHAQGGEKFAVGGRVVELEGGEAVINKRSTAMFRNQLSSMNSAGGGVKFADGGLMSSPSFTESSFAASNQSQMMGAMQGQRKVVVVESDITTSQSTVSVIQANATF